MRPPARIAFVVLAAIMGCSQGTGGGAPDGGQTSCPSGQKSCAGACVDTLVDPMNCGACGQTCAAPEVCSEGLCFLSCASGAMNCAGSCRNVQIDPGNCGSCGNTCEAGQSCTGGACTGNTCDAPNTLCTLDGGTFCTSLDSDPFNCGTCGTVCSASENCNSGACQAACSGTDVACPFDGGSTCTNTHHDSANCGACGHACASGSSCVNGTCSSSSAGCSSDETQCTPSSGAPYCADTTSDTSNCGGCGISCPSGYGCNASQCTFALSLATTATATSSSYGDTGGSTFGPDVCPAGQAMIGFSGNHGGNIDTIQGDCGSLAVVWAPSGSSIQVAAQNSLPSHGINATNPYTADCPPNQVVTRVDGWYDPVTEQGGSNPPTQGVHQLAVYCSSLTVSGSPGNPRVAASPPTLLQTVSTDYDLSNSTPFSYACSSGAMNGYGGASGYWLDSIYFQCFAL